MKKFGLLFPLILSASASAFAVEQPNIKLDGKIAATIPLYQGLRATTNPEILAHGGKKITFERVKLSKAAQQFLVKHIDDQISHSLLKSSDDAVTNIQLGMNKVPVLDQGQHGTCVTFATTAALDATITKGDYISQLCNLSLGRYLEEQNPNYPSGWDGSWGEIVLDQIKDYGIINQAYQKEKGCGGLYSYPTYDENNIGGIMNVKDFTSHSEKLEKIVTWKTILPPSDSMHDMNTMKITLQKAKQALANKHRLSVGILVDVNAGDIGAYGSYKSINDSWVLTPRIKRDAKRNLIEAGHELVITGYDDNAEVTDNEGGKHKGLFTLRNSWGVDAGDAGNYYMSYEYFEKLGLELIEIIPNKA